MNLNFAYPRLWRFFEEISAIPRGSYNEKAIADYFVAFAKARSLECYRDELNNVLINLPASKGYENEEPMLLQAHMDMVCEKNGDVVHDFEKDGLELYEEDGWIRARGTTLGADNGVGVAIMLYILDGGMSSHPAIQCLFTAMEEVGMYGAHGFDHTLIYARQLLSLDGTSPDVVVSGSSGGLCSTVTMKMTEQVRSGTLVSLSVNGLAGGHSGDDIHRGRTNANKLIGYILSELYARLSGGLSLVSVSGGSKTNAIPREAEACFICGDDAYASYLSEIESNVRSVMRAEDLQFKLNSKSEAVVDVKCFDGESTKRVIDFISILHSGVVEMNAQVPEFVAFSRNLGVMRTEGDEVKISISSRSAHEHQIDRSGREVEALAAILGGKTEHSGKYPGWSFSEKSAIREKYFAVYEKKYGKKPRVVLTHGGLECGLFKSKMPDLDIINCGAVILDLHSPDERLCLKSLEEFTELVEKMLESK